MLTSTLGRLDVLQWVAGIDGDHAYEHLAAAAVESDVLGQPVRICSRADLLLMKRAAGRPEDLRDLEALGDGDDPASR